MIDSPPSQFCPKCGNDELEAEPLEREYAGTFFDFYHPADGTFRFEVRCLNCSWSDRRRLETEELTDD